MSRPVPGSQDNEGPEYTALSPTLAPSPRPGVVRGQLAGKEPSSPARMEIGHDLVRLRAQDRGLSSFLN